MKTEKHSPPQTQQLKKTARTLSGIAQYSGAWTQNEVIHLLRRTMFGVKKADVDYFTSLSMTQAIDELLNVSTAASPPPLNYYNTGTNIDPDVPWGQTWVNAPVSPNFEFLRRKTLRAWWTGEIINQERSILQKMMVFWHNHFAVEFTSVASARLCYGYYELIRQSILGNFKTFTKNITLDSAMMVYLNNYKNTAAAPDENYARELQELFTVGKALNPHYTEDDVKAAAKVLTGYRINPTTYLYYFDSTKHDTSNKTFSSFYNNTVISGQSGANGANELDDLLNMIFAHSEVAKNICRKLYKFFVYYEIDANVETDVILPLADVFRNNNYDILPVMQTLLKSEHFFDMANRGCVIRPPLDFCLGLARTFGVTFPDVLTSPDALYNNWHKVATLAESMQQNLGDPPSVAGWNAYYQAPQFHEMWINSVTVPYRRQFTDRMITSGYTTSSFKLVINPMNFVETLSTPNDPDVVVNESVMLLLGIDVSQAQKDYLKNILLSGQSGNAYWANAWDNYYNDPTNTAYINIVKTRLTTFFQYLLSIAEHHLS